MSAARPAQLTLLAAALTVLALAGVLFALYVHPAHAQSATTLVSNINVSTNDNNTIGGTSNKKAAQKFTVPDGEQTYALTAVAVHVRTSGSGGSGFLVAVHAVNGDNPGDRLYTLSGPGNPDSGNKTYTAPGNAPLASGTSYFVVFSKSGNHITSLQQTTTNSQSGLTGWTIDNSSRARDNDNDWSSDDPLKIKVSGYELLDDTPTNLTANPVAPTRVSLDWQMPDNEVKHLTGYRIEGSDNSNGPWTSLVNFTNQKQDDPYDYWPVSYGWKFNDNTIEPGTTRYYRVIAFNDDGQSLPSEVVHATTPGLVDSDGGKFGFGAVVSEFDSLRDQKVFRFNLNSGESYRFTIAGKATRHRVVVTGPGSTEIWNDVLDSNNNLIPRFTTQGDGIHQVKISHGGTLGNAGSLNAGRFQFVLVPVRERAKAETTLGAGDSVHDVVLNTYGDVDQFKLLVDPGKAYAVRVRGRSGNDTTHGTAETPRIKSAKPPLDNHVYNMGKPWVEGVTIAKASPICHGFAEPEKCEFQAFVIDLRGQTGAQQTWRINVTPTARPRTYPYHVGTYAVLLDVISDSDLAGVRTPLRAWFASQPKQHDGSNRIKVRVAFSDAVDESPENVGEHSVSVNGGEVTSVRPVGDQVTGGSEARKGARSADGQEDEPEDREVVWEFEIEPDANRDVTVSLEAWRPCDEPGAICTADGRALSKGISTTVPNSLPLTASFQDVPEAHDGESTFTFRTAFSHNIGISFRALREDAFTVTGGTVTNGQRVHDRRDLFEITLRPDSNRDVTITLPTGRDCGVSGAICTKGENRRQLTNNPSATVAGPPNTAAEGAPTISGTLQVDEELTASTSGISDGDGLENVSFTHQWLADDTAIQGATSSTYILTEADEGKAIKVSVSFTDDADNGETLTSAAMDAVTAAAQSNSPAMGAPVITSTPQVGETLTVDTSGIADEDGLTNDTFSYRWLADDAEISGATGSTYTLTGGDEGKAITVQVSFTDDAGNAETLTSAATASVAGPVPAKPTGLSATASYDQVVLTWNDPQDDSIDGYVILRRNREDDAKGKFSILVGNTGNAATTYTDDSVQANTTYTYRIKAINEHGVSERSRWFHIDTPAAPEPPEPVNSPATGAPAISGTVQVGEELTAGTSGIADEDGLENATFGYQWLAGDSDIAGAAGSTYTLSNSDEGKVIKVRVSFTDDAGNEEELTSAATDAVAAAGPSEPPARPRGLDATATHDQVVLTWDEPGDDSITGYVILRRLRYDDPKGHFDKLVADTGTAATTYTDDTVAAETSYTYRIKAINEYGVSERSRWFHIDTLAAPDPAGST